MTPHHAPLRFLFGFAVLWSVLYGFGRIGETSIGHGVPAAITILFLALLLERRVLGTPLRDVPARLGLGRPGVRALVAAVSVSLITLTALPAYAHIADEHLELRPGWPWLAVSLLAYHGFAEELCWRGYTYGRLRCGRSFGAAVAATMPLIAITHLPVVIESGFAVGVAAVVVAAITCIPLAHLYELGRRTIWPCALVHAAIDGFKLIDDPQRYAGLSAAIAGAALVCPFAAFAWSRHPRSRANPPLQTTDALEPGVLITREDQP